MNTLLENFDLVATSPEGIAQLRKYILELAVRGKLVPQDKNDEPASVLLEKIKAEKARLVKAGKLKAPKELPEIGEEEKPYELPVGWEWARLVDVTQYWIGRTPPSKENSYWSSTGTNWVSISDMPDGGRIVGTNRHLSLKGVSQFSVPLSKAGSILMSFKLTIGKTAILDVDAYHNEAIITVIPYDGVLKDFVFKILPVFAKKGTTKDALMGLTLNSDSLSRILLPLPPLAEQSRIVSRVQELMAVLDRLEARSKEAKAGRSRALATLSASLPRAESSAEQKQKWRLLSSSFDSLVSRAEDVKALRSLVLELAVRGKLVPQDKGDEPASILLDKIRAEKARLVKAGKIKAPKELPEISVEEKPYELPVGWEWVRVETLGEIKLGRQRSPENHRGPHMVPYLRVANVFENRIDITDINEMNFTPQEQRTFGLMKGDLLLNEGQSYELVGRPAIYNDELPGACFQNTLIRVRPYFIQINEFMLITFRSYMRSGRFQQEAQQTTNIAHLSASRLSYIEVPLPPLAEQSRIVARVQELMAVLERLEAKLAAKEEAGRKYATAAVAL